MYSLIKVNLCSMLLISTAMVLVNASSGGDNDSGMFSSEDLDYSILKSTENADESTQSLKDQVRLLSKQMTALMNRRREDYKMLENSLLNSVRKKSASQFGGSDSGIHSELIQLRYVFYVFIFIVVCTYIV